MARNVWDISINEDTSREDLERCILEAARSSDQNITRAAAIARAELARRKREERKTRFNAESKERVSAQKFQEAQVARQLEVANKHADAAKGSAAAAKWSAGATIALAIATTVLAAAALAPHLSAWLFQLNR